jgi:hypothetical protein
MSRYLVSPTPVLAVWRWTRAVRRLPAGPLPDLVLSSARTGQGRVSGVAADTRLVGALTGCVPIDGPRAGAAHTSR